MATSISSITGLQNLPNLENFNADYNFLETIDLSGLTNLTYADVSRCDLPNSGQSSLTSANFSGCTSLVECELNDSDFSNGMPDLTGCTSLEWIDLDQSNLSGTIDFTGLPNLKGFDLYDNIGVTSVLTDAEQLLGDGRDVNLSVCSLTSGSIDQLVLNLNSSGVENGNLYIDGGSNAAPSDLALSAIEDLVEKGWTVQHN